MLFLTKSIKEKVCHNSPLRDLHKNCFKNDIETVKPATLKHFKLWYVLLFIHVTVCWVGLPFLQSYRTLKSFKHFLWKRKLFHSDLSPTFLITLKFLLDLSSNTFCNFSLSSFHYEPHYLPPHSAPFPTTKKSFCVCPAISGAQELPSVKLPTTRLYFVIRKTFSNNYVGFRNCILL